MSNHLFVAFVWHLHQPYYRNSVTKESILPWVRLHTAKDYRFMLKALENFGNVRATLNLVPSLIEQILDYTERGMSDKFLDLSVKRPEDMTEAEKYFVLHNFFLANWEKMIKRYSYYYDLLLKRGLYISVQQLPSIAKRFSNQELRDLQVYFNLVWLDEYAVRTDPAIKEILKKQRRYSEEDKAAVIGKQFEIMRETLPLYKKMALEGRVEISMTPYYHPILPLLCDTEIARVSNPGVKLPENRFRHPEDASWHISGSREY